MGCNIEEYKDYVLCYIGETKGLHGVGFLIKKVHKYNIANFKGVSERVALLQLKFDELCISIIQVYAPTERANEEEILKFYNDVSKALALADTRVIVMGDFNAKIGHPKKEESLIMGNYGFGERNERGERLINFALEHKLSIMNTFFKKKPSKKWTWISPDEKTKNEIDFIMVNNSKLITNVETLTYLNFASDHRLLRATFLLNQPKKSRKTFKILPKVPKTRDEINFFINHLKSEIENQQIPTNVQMYYNVLEKSIKNSLTLKTDTVKKRHKIFSETTENLIKKRTELTLTKNKDITMKKELSKLFKQTNKSIRNDYCQHRQSIITTNLKKFRSIKKAAKQLNLYKTWIQKLSRQVDETITRKDVVDQATKFYKELYKKRETTDRMEEPPSIENTPNEIKPIDDIEVYEHIKQLKTEKSPGPDGLTNEILKLGAPVLLSHLAQLFNMVLVSETVPLQWCTSDIILLFKKGNPFDIGNYRPISLLGSIYKLFASILLKRISSKIDNFLPIEQAGFRSGFSTTDHIQTLEQVIEKYKEFNRPLYLCFIDYTKAFDSISHNAIWAALKMSHVEQKYINIMKNIYKNNTSTVKLERRGDPIKIERGVRQGDPLSPKLFIAVLENIFRKLKWTRKGINVHGSYLNHLEFADDIVLLAESPKELQEMILSLNHESSKIGLEMNGLKTKIMTNSHQIPIAVNGTNIDYVNNYIYLGKQVSFTKSNNEEEIARRINLTWKKFWALKEILKGNYSLNLKKIVIDTCLLPCLLYGCQTWVFTNKAKHKIRTTQRAIERSILNIRKIYKIKSSTIRQKTKVMDALKQALTLKWQWAGHISRYSDKRWTIQTTRWKGPEGKRDVGRPNKRWTDDIAEIAGRDWMTLAKERGQWKRVGEAFTQEGAHISLT